MLRNFTCCKTKSVIILSCFTPKPDQQDVFILILLSFLQFNQLRSFFALFSHISVTQISSCPWLYVCLRLFCCWLLFCCSSTSRKQRGTLTVSILTTLSAVLQKVQIKRQNIFIVFLFHRFEPKRKPG